jgi:hypothetical protein
MKYGTTEAGLPSFRPSETAKQSDVELPSSSIHADPSKSNRLSSASWKAMRNNRVVGYG